MPVYSKAFSSKLLSRETRENTQILQVQAAKTCRYFLFTQDSPNSQLEFPWSQILGTALSTQRLEQSLELPSAGAGEETFVSAEKKKKKSLLPGKSTEFNMEPQNSFPMTVTEGVATNLRGIFFFFF